MTIKTSIYDQLRLDRWYENLFEVALLFFKAQILSEGHKIWEKITHYFIEITLIFQIFVALSEYLNFMIYRVSYGKMTMSICSQ